MDSGFDSDIITNIVELQLLDFLGVKPYLNGCAVCGSPTDIVTISSYAGGYLCKNCYHDEPLVSTKTLQMIRMLSMVDLEKVTKIKVSAQVKKELNQFFGRLLRSLYGPLFTKPEAFEKLTSIRIGDEDMKHKRDYELLLLSSY